MIAACGLAVAGCSTSSGLDIFKPAPQTVSLQIESQPPGADVTTSLGPACKTPCALPITPDKDFTVSYALKGYKPETVSVQVATSAGKTFVDPNPLVMELEALPAAQPKRRPVRRRPVAKKPAPTAAATAPKPAAAAPAASPAPAAASSPPPMTIPGSAAAPSSTTPWPPIQQ
jgi:hypothetical protein